MLKRISHIGIVVDDVNAAVEFWTKAFGFKKFDDLRIEVEGIHSVFLSLGGTANEMAIELMEPLNKSDMNNAISRRLAKKGEGFYHLAVETDDIKASGKKLAARGMQLIDRPPATKKDAPRWLVHPKDANGVMVEGMEKM